jgi:hypothetical protein
VYLRQGQQQSLNTTEQAGTHGAVLMKEEKKYAAGKLKKTHDYQNYIPSVLRI